MRRFAVLVMALGFLATASTAGAKKRPPSPCETACLGAAGGNACLRDCNRLRPKCGRNRDCKGGVLVCAPRCAAAWPDAADARRRKACVSACKTCLSRKGPKGVCGGRDIQCCGQSGEPPCCAGGCCTGGETCCRSAVDPSAPGRCVDTTTDETNCKVCNKHCAQDQSCIDSACVDNDGACPVGKMFCGSLNNTAGITACCDADQLCCPLALTGYICSAAGGKCCDFRNSLGFVQFPCPADHTCCGGLTNAGATVVGCCPPDQICGTGSNGAPECQRP